MEVKRDNRDRVEAETSANIEAEMKEKVERTRKAREAKVNVEAENMERAKVWSKSKAKEKV